jgi:hypothetical protein
MDLHQAFNFAMARGQRNVRIRNWFVGILSVVGVGLLWFTGFGFFATIGLALVVILIIVFGSLGKLVSSFVIASLLNMFLPTIKEFVFVFVSGARTQQLFILIENVGWVKLTMVIFLFTYALSYFTGCFQFLKVNASTKVENNSGD